MLKKLLIPVLAFTVAAIGCGGGSNDTTGGGAGSGGSTAGAGGSTAGADGSTAGADGWTAGTDAAAGVDGADGAEVGTGLDSPPAGADVVCTLQTFCPVFLTYCGTTTPGYTTLAECMTSFAAVGAANALKQQCESYHLCNAIYDTGDDRALHCGHAAGAGTVCDPQPI